MAVGPVEYLAVAFPGNRSTGAIASAPADTDASEAVRVIDPTFVHRAGDGTIETVERDDLGPDGLDPFEPVESAVTGTAVVAGTASAVSGRDRQHQRERSAEREMERPGAAPAPGDLIDQLEWLGELNKRGVLTDAEFAARKNRLLAE
ncbi:SHOCT domain-containing protein [Streptomyces sp. NPDC088726]|uniref:SHOCT domain-containing protein n=2 Tax=unclassified Streptomyces TaxID=2593676 RepID=UPI00382C2625